MVNSIQLSIEGMHCGACVRRVTAALEGIQGVRVESVEVGSARVKLDSAVTTGQIEDAINRIGFTAQVQK